MRESAKRWCVLIPCSSAETWAVPQNCLGEIFTVHTDNERPPGQVEWRGETVPVLDFGQDDGSQWRDPGRGAQPVPYRRAVRGNGLCRHTHGHRDRHDADRTGAGNQHVLADQVE